MRSRPVLFLLALAWPGTILAQPGAAPVPQRHIPPPVLMELRALESQFDLALARDCAPERCASKGCLYRDHVVVDMPRAGSLPGLNQAEGPGSVPVQEYLTQARCEFAHEKSVSARDVQALARRLEQRLSKGWLQVTVGRQPLDPISPSLSESPPPRPEPAPPARVEPPRPSPSPPAPARWESGVALRELWLGLLPHFAWMIAMVMATLAALMVIWALRRLGRESLAEKAVAAQLSTELSASPLDKEKENEKEEEGPTVPAGAPGESPPGGAAAAAAGGDLAASVSEQRRSWTERIARAELGQDQGLVAAVLRQWLKAGELDLLAKALLVFGDRLSSAFAADGELAARKVELAEHLRTIDEGRLPSDVEFFRRLNQQALSAALLSQADAELYRSIGEEFGTAGLGHLIASLPPRQGALLFALTPSPEQAELARLLSPVLRVQVADQLFASSRMSREEQDQVFAALEAARAGRPLPPVPVAAASTIVDRGRPVDAAGALSVLLAQTAPEDRQALFARALERGGGALPAWCQDILHPDMILKLPHQLRADMLLEVDIKGLAGWASLQPPAWRRSFVEGLAPSLQHALQANIAGFASPSDQVHLARLGRRELVAAVKRLLARGELSFLEVVI